MDYSKRIIRGRLTLLTAAGVLLTGGVGASALLAAPTQAATCAAGANCTVTGTLTLGAGTLNLTTSASLGWTAAATGVDQHLVDPTAADETYTVVDATGTCTLPTHTTTPTTFPVAITTAATTPTTFVIYDANAATGIGSIAVGGSTAAAPVGWWLNVPGNAVPGTYTSTILMAVVSTP